MAERVKTTAFDQRYKELKQTLMDFGEVIGKGAYDRCQSGVLSDKDALELQTGAFYLLSGLEEMFKDADLLVENMPGAKPGVSRLVGHARALIGGALFVARHLDVTESAKKLNHNQQTAAAREGRSKGREERLQVARRVLEKAARKPNGKLLNPGKELERVNAALLLDKDDQGDSLHKPLSSTKTLERYAEAIRSERTK